MGRGAGGLKHPVMTITAESVGSVGRETTRTITGALKETISPWIQEKIDGGEDVEDLIVGVVLSFSMSSIHAIRASGLFDTLTDEQGVDLTLRITNFVFDEVENIND